MDWQTIMMATGVFLLFLMAIGFSFFPILPAIIFSVAGIILYAAVRGYATFPIWFWILQGIVVILYFLVDNFSGVVGVKRVGGSSKAIWGSMIGLLIFPFLLGPLGMLMGPVVGAIVGEIWHRRSISDPGSIAKVGAASLAGFLAGNLVKLILVGAQITGFVMSVLKQ